MMTSLPRRSASAAIAAVLLAACGGAAPSTAAVHAPSIATIAPPRSPASGGTSMVIRGVGFAPGAKVRFGDTPAADVTWLAEDELAALAPPHAAARVDVTVQNPDGSESTLPAAVEYLADAPPPPPPPPPPPAPPGATDAPTLAGLSPSSAPTAGGVAVTLSGTGLVAGTTVTFGAVAATVTSATGARLVAVVPTHAAGAVDVVVTSPFGRAALAGAFVFVAPPPTLALGVRGVPPTGGTVTFGGSGFQQGASVTFGGVASPSVALDPVAKVLVVTAPPHAEGLVDVVVTNPDGQSATFTGFNYGPRPAPASFTPGVVAKPGDVITITGASFSGVQVLFGPALAQVLSQTATTVTVAAPKQNPGSYPIIVTNFDGQYAAAPGAIVYP